MMLLFGTAEINASIDALIYRNALSLVSIDSILNATLSGIINIDALLKLENAVEMTSSTLLDAVLYSVLVQSNPFQAFITTETKSAFIYIKS